MSVEHGRLSFTFGSLVRFRIALGVGIPPLRTSVAPGATSWIGRVLAQGHYQVECLPKGRHGHALGFWTGSFTVVPQPPSQP